MPCTYAPETYKEVLTWLENTPIKYNTNPKQKGSKSFDRYARYSKAKTVGQALKLGTYYLDLLFDYEHGHLRAVGGPKRKTLVDPNKSAWDDSWTKTDKVLSTMHARWITWTKTFEVADRLGVDRRNLTSNKMGGISVELHASRMESDVMARLILEQADATKAKVTDADLLQVLRLWGFRQNTTRQNVMKDGIEWVNSDTLGLLAGYDGTVMVNGATRHYPSVPRLLCRWLVDHLPAEMSRGFMFTSINVNRGYAARLHRDGNNEGPSMIAAFGEFSGGELCYWAEDDKTKATIETLRKGDEKLVDLRKNLLMFDGNRGHAVEEFEGERFSIVYFSIGRAHKASAAERKQLAAVGIPAPDSEGLAWMKSMLSPPLGYGEKAEKACGKRTPFRVWPRRTKESPIVSTLSEERIAAAKEAAKFVEPPQEEDDNTPADTKFVGHVKDRKVLEDGRRMLRVYLKGASGRLVLAVTGVEEKKGAARYEYKRVDGFKHGKPLCTHQLWEVRAWLEQVVSKRAKAAAEAAEGGRKRKAAPPRADGKGDDADADDAPPAARRRPSGAARAATTTKEPSTPGGEERRTSRAAAAKKEMRAAGAAQASPEKGPRPTPAGGKREALEAFLLCTEETGIRYTPKAKTAESHRGSCERYAAYSTATTLGQALELGASASDLLYDWQAGFLKLATGRRRKTLPSAEEDLGSSRFGRLASRWRAALQQL